MPVRPNLICVSILKSELTGEYHFHFVLSRRIYIPAQKSEVVFTKKAGRHLVPRLFGLERMNFLEKEFQTKLCTPRVVVLVRGRDHTHRGLINGQETRFGDLDSLGCDRANRRGNEVRFVKSID